MVIPSFTLIVFNNYLYGFDMPRITRALTNTEVSRAKPKDKIYYLQDGNGLRLKILTSGTKTWYFEYIKPYTDKPDSYRIGRYPAISLSEARSVREECMKLLAKNIDPKQHFKNKDDIEKKKLANDFKSVFDEWLPTKNYSQGTLDKMQNYIDEVLAVIGNMPVSEITVPDLMQVLRPVEEQEYFTKLQKMRTMISHVMTHAIATGRATDNPALHLKGVFKTGEVTHNPAILDESRIKDLVREIDIYSGHFVTRQALKFLMLMFSRPGEVRHLKWSDIDFDKKVWNYTPNKTKHTTQIEMVTPLSAQALLILEQMKGYRQSEFVFPSVISTLKPLSTSTFNQALRRMGFDGSEQTSHGFRAMARTLLEEKFRYDYRMIEMQLGHKVRDANGRAYNRVQWLDDRREMMQAWADYLDELKVR